MSTTHNLMALWESGLYADLTLRFVHQQTEVCALRCHKPVLHASQLPFMQALLDERHSDVAVQLPWAWSARQLRVFMQLLYAPAHPETTAQAEQLAALYAYVDRRPLHFYHLAQYMTHDALAQRCVARLARQLDDALYGQLLDFCLLDGECRDESVPLYRRALHWRQYCAKPLLHDAPPQHLLPAKQLRPQHVSYYRATCHDCVHSAQTRAYDCRAVDLGGLRCGDARCDLALWCPTMRRGPASLMLRLNQGGARGEDDMSVESECELVAHTRLQVVSRRGDAPQETRRCVTLQQYVELARIVLPPRDECYEGQCGLCERADQALYIVHVEIGLIKES